MLVHTVPAAMAPKIPSPHAQLTLDDQVPDVVRQFASHDGEAVHAVDDAVVPLDDGVPPLMIREPRKRDAHVPTMRSPPASGITIFRPAPARR